MSIFESLENLNVSEECFDEIVAMVEELLDEDLPSAIEKRYPRDKVQQEYNDEVDKNGIKNWDKLQQIEKKLEMHRKAENWAKDSARKEREHGLSAQQKQNNQLINNQVIDYDDGTIEFVSTPKNRKEAIKKAIKRHQKKQENK